MGKDRDRTGAADSRGESSEEPDEFDSLVLDEDFIAAGIPEASLPRYQRAIPPQAVSSENHPEHRPHMEGPRSPSGPHSSDSSDSADDADDADGTWPPQSHHSRRQRRTTGMLLAAAALLVLGVVLTAFLHLRSGLRQPGGTGASFDTAADAFRKQIAGLPPMTPQGTCFDVRSATSSLIAVTPCSQQHRYELVGVEQATGASTQYPGSSYWEGPIDHSCARDVQTLTGKAPVDWPAGLHIGSFPPTANSWATGDRTVYCIADSVPSVSGNLQQLNTSAAPTG